MHSSTFSFDRVPASRWWVTGISAIVVAAALLGGFETFWRVRGAETTHVDDPRRWSYFRDQIDSATGKYATLLLGSSKMQLGWSIDRFRSMLPHTRAIQLAINGGSPFPVLRDIADNTNFRGVIIVDLIERWIVPGFEAEKRTAQVSLKRIDYYSGSWNLNTKINFLLDNFLQEHLISRQPLYGLRRTINFYDEHSRLQPAPYYLETRFDRERDANYRLRQVGKWAGWQPGAGSGGGVARKQPHNFPQVVRAGSTRRTILPFRVSEKAWQQRIAELARIVRRLTQRGARVVFVRFPTSGEGWKRNNEEFPRHLYWDRLASSVPGYWVHFQDIPALKGIRLPDGDHADISQKKLLTTSVVRKLQELGIYPGADSPSQDRLVARPGPA